MIASSPRFAEWPVNTPQRNYGIYGLRLRSDWDIPGLPDLPATDPTDIQLLSAPEEVFLNARRRLPFGPLDWCNRVLFADGSEYLLWPGMFEFLVSPDGRVIRGNMLHDGTAEALEVYLLGQVLSFALIKRGTEPLHATAVVIDGEAIAFAADCTFGKSTLAAAFLQAGFPLLTDDLLVTQCAGTATLAYPGPPRIKLLPESAEALLPRNIPASRMNPYTNKLVIPLGRGQRMSSPVPLSRIYLLADPDESTEEGRIDRISPREALVRLIANTSNTEVVEPERNRQLLAFYSEMLSRVQVRTLAYPREFGALPNVVACILSELRER